MYRGKLPILLFCRTKRTLYFYNITTTKVTPSVILRVNYVQLSSLTEVSFEELNLFINRSRCLRIQQKKKAAL